MFKRILGVSLATVMALTSTVSALALTPADGLLTATGDYANSTGSVIADKDAVDINGVVGKDTTQGKYSQYDVVVDGYTGTTMDDTTSETEVYATVLPMFMTRIPKVLVLSAAGECQFAVSVKGDISGAQTVLIKPEAEQFDMVEVDPITGNPIGKKDNVPATISVDDIDWTYATDFKTVDAVTYVDHTGSILADGLTAGSWRGTFNFLIGLNVLGGGNTPAPDAPEGDETTNYTVEEIEADETLIMLGATKPEYVVADFNDDYTEVIITKNGEDSDGVMAVLMNLDEGEFTSPMSFHSDTLTNAVIKDGVVNVGVGAFFNLAAMMQVGEGLDTASELYRSSSDSKLTVTLSDTVESIDDFAFYASELKSIKMSNNLKSIGLGSFCASTIEYIDLPESLVDLGDSSFSQSLIRSIKIPSQVTSLNSTFTGCLFLEEIDLNNVSTLLKSDFLISSNEVFLNCLSLKTVKNGKVPADQLLEHLEKSYLDFANNLINIIKETLTDGSVLFYAIEADGTEHLLTGCIADNAEYYVHENTHCISYLNCGANVKLHIPENTNYNHCSIYINDVRCFNDNIIPNRNYDKLAAENLTIYSGVGSESETIANREGHTFIVE